ncbi:hypothetical protein C8R43DRAFT_896852, partial [Mycena crocata]
PKWASEALALFCEVDAGHKWNATVAMWTQLERAYGFKSSPNGLSKAGRPTVIDVWIKTGRGTDKLPNFSPEKDIPAWWEWWAGLAPTWREKNAAGRPVIGRQGPWGTLAKPGANGMLTVILGLAWWYTAEGEATEDWLAALKDVTWVLRGLLSEAK